MADTRSLQRKINRVSQIETFAKSDLSREPIAKVKAQIKLLNKEWDDYRANEKNYKDSAEIIELQDTLESKLFEVQGKLLLVEVEKEEFNNNQASGEIDTSLQQLIANQRTFLNDVTSLNSRGDSDVRLPRVNVPFFSGTYSEFASFRDLFEASINSNPKISKVHKLQYLKGLLKGEAAALVRHISITEANYDEAWEIITNRYDKKKQVTTMLLKQFLDQPSITQASAKSLHHMRDVSDEVLRGLKVLGDQAEMRDPWLIHILVSKLDPITRHDWAQHSFDTEFPTVKFFFEFLNKQSDTLESCETTKRNTHRQSQNPNLKVMHADTQSVNCLKCNQNHYLRNCEEFLRLPYQTCRALLDSGAQASFISEACAQRLALPRKNASILIKGLTPGTETTRGLMAIKAVSQYSKTEAIDIDVLILHKLTNCIPSCEINDSNFRQIQDLELADPNFYKPGRVDIIIGADRFFNILREGRIERLENNLTAQYSMFGWVLSGEATINQNKATTTYNCHVGLNVDESLRRFWEIEEIPPCHPFSQEESDCEEHFKLNLLRHDTGKFIVKLPIKNSKTALGNSLNMAKKRFFNLENKLNRDPKLKAEYVNIIREYQSMGHLEEIMSDTKTNEQENPNYYLPHHAVTKADSTTTKLRVVFDGSSKTTSGYSLNDILMVGPTIQPTLWSTLLNFRYNKYALTADIEKMYRQVMVTTEDQELQRIIWRENVSDPLKHYKLTTVTFGMASSAFLAIRCLQQVAFDFQEEHPIITEEILNKFYIDDYLSGANTIDEAQYLKDKLNDVLMKRGFKLRKWHSNAIGLSDQTGDRETTSVPIKEANSSTKILGLQWDSKNDQLSFKVKLPAEPIATKRTLISNASKVFDPLGLLSPSIIIAKILYQKLWLRKLEWDDELPADIALLWNQLKAELPQLEQISIPRYINKSEMQIHGFCDASERAYAAVIYSRFKDENNKIHTEIITSKTKVAPIKQISLPRLELCGAHLLSKLINEVRKTLPDDIPVYSWSDSSIVLAWLSDHPSKWKTFVANRVSEIQAILPRNHWNHVKSESNPADYASRGVLPSKLITLDQWWHGPEWLSKREKSWPIAKQEVYYDDTISELKGTSAIPLFHVQGCPDEHIYNLILSKTFSFSKAIRILCFIHRFVENSNKPREARQTSAISLREISNATERLIKWLQHKEYAEDIRKLTKNQMLPTQNHLSSLTPFLDANGILRVGGRLKNSVISYEFKHPIILPNSHILSRMIISFFHLKYLHPGPSHTSHLIRQVYWIVKGRAVIRDVVRKCVQCFRTRATTAKQLMSDLPAVRVTPAKPFSNCGIDYAGPIVLASKRGRGAKMVKGYIAIFVCMVTKAIHIEAVTELTTEAFMAALKRFSARRNVPLNIYSDNGTNFTGANRNLKEVYTFHKSKTNDLIITEFCTHNEINWHHIPPSAPHFGGLWESAVKSVKSHINRVTGNCHLTFEEISTLLCQIEAVLNSRPLYPISEDDESFDALTPAHFLMGSSVAAVPEHKLENLTTSRLSRWQQVEQRAQSFWKRFHKEYLNSLQQRHKWRNTTQNIKIGELVLIKEDNLPTCKWAMGRILEIYPDDKGLVRVVKIKTAKNIITRPIAKICLLPVD